MTFEIYDSWANRIVERGLAYCVAARFLDREQPPFHARHGSRYYILPEPFRTAGQPPLDTQ